MAAGDRSQRSSEQPAPLRLRAAAFLADLVVVAGGVLATGATGAASVSVPLVLVVFVAYHTSLTWLTETTIGKTIFDLHVRRITNAPYARRPRSLIWVLARSSVGYLLCDVFIVGWLVALLHPQRRPLHDLIFRSTVTWGGAAFDRAAIPKRIEQFARKHDQAIEDVGQRHKTWRKLAAWLITGIAFLDKIITALRRVGSWIARRISARTPSHTEPQPATPLRTKDTAGLVVVTTVASSVIWTILLQPGSEDLRPNPEPEVELTGTWQITRSHMTERPAGSPPEWGDFEGVRFELTEEACGSAACPVLIEDVIDGPGDALPGSPLLTGVRLRPTTGAGPVYSIQIDQPPFFCDIAPPETDLRYSGTTLLTFERDESNGDRLSGTYAAEGAQTTRDPEAGCPTVSSLAIEFTVERVS